MDSSSESVPVCNSRRTPGQVQMHSAPREKLASVLPAAKEFILDLGGDFADEQARIGEIAGRLESSRFHLAVLGQFKRGKSTLLNALLGAQLLPSAVVPLTSMPTYISWSDHKTASVTLNRGEPLEFTTKDTGELSKFLSRYVTEESNPRNKLGVKQVEVKFPSPLLRDGVVLIDTPGIGSTFQHNTEATLSFIPNCDAALFLVSADPPVTQVELEFLQTIRPRVTHFFFIMNKVDYLSSDEQRQAVEFFKGVLREQIGFSGNDLILCVSARQGLEARLKHDKNRWESSGMSEVENQLIKFLAEEKNRVLTQALSRKAQDVFKDSLLRLHLQQRSLTLPLDDLEHRLSVLDEKLREAENQKIRVQDMLAGDKKRTLEFVEQQATEMRLKVIQQFATMIEKDLSGADTPDKLEKIAHQKIAVIVTGLFDRALTESAANMDKHIKHIFDNYLEQYRKTTESIQKSAADIFDVPYSAPRDAAMFELKHEPFWVKDTFKVSPSPLPEDMLDRLLPRQKRIARLKKRLLEDIDSIVSRNVGNLQWSMKLNTNDTFYKFTYDFDRKIKQTIEATLGSIKAAQSRRVEKAEDIELDLRKMDARIEEAESIHSKLKSIEAAVSR